MSRSLRSILPLALGLSLTSLACGGSDSGTDDTTNPATGNTATGGDNTNGASGTNGSTGSSGGTNGSTGSSTDSTGSTGTDACTAPGQQCMCTNGQMGFQACTNGMLGECTCGIDLSDAGLPPPSECPETATCQGTMGAIMGVDGFCAPSAGGDGGGAGMNGGFPGGLSFPPMCTSQDDCTNAGLPDAVCQSIMIPFVGAQQLCVQPCIP